MESGRLHHCIPFRVFQVPQVELLATQPRLAPDGEFSFESDRVVCVILLQDALQAKLNHIKNLMTMKRHSGFEYETT